MPSGDRMARLSRREILAAGALAALPAVLATARRAQGEEFSQIPIPPDAARSDPFHAFWDRLPEEFPVADGLRYFNTAGLAIAPYEVHQRVHETMLEAARSGEALRDRLDATRDTLARFLGAHPDEIALTRNATESMNLVARGLDFKRGDEIVLTTHEHPGGAAPWVALHQDAGVVLRLYDPVFDAERDRAGLLALCGKRTRAVVFSHVFSTVGALMPAADIAADAQRRGLLCIVDGAQAAGILPLDLHALGADAYLASGHKWLLGPVETGFLYVRRDRLPLVRGRFAGAYAADATGWSLEEGRLDFLPVARRFEYGTRSPALATGLAEALLWQEAIGWDLLRARALALAARFHTAASRFPGIEVLTPAAAVGHVPIVTFRVTRRPNTQVQEWLRRELGMRVRLVGERGMNAVRASFHAVNRTSDVDWLAEAVRVLGA